jgi:integrase
LREKAKRRTVFNLNGGPDRIRTDTSGFLVPSFSIRIYQNARVSEGVKGRTINLEVNLLRIVMKRAKRWSVIADEVRNMPESRDVIGRVLTLEEKKKLFSMASSKSSWMVAFCAAVIAVSSTCRKIEIMNLKWADVDLFARTFQIRRSKTAAGHRLIPMNADSLEAFVRLRQRAEKHNGGGAEGIPIS